MIELKPKWKKIKQIAYSVYRRDFFRAGDNTRYPIENRYDLQFKHLHSYPYKTVLEAIYPDGILKLLTSFQPYSSLIGLENDFTQDSGNQFSYTVDLDSQIENLTNLKQIHQYGFWLENEIAESDLKTQKKKNITAAINWFFEDEKDKHDYLLRDIDILHEFYGLKIKEPIFFDFVEEDSDTIDTSKLSKKERKILARFEEMQEGRSMVKIDYDDDLVYLDTLWGVNLASVSEEYWHDFRKIRDDFKANDFDIEQYYNITLHHKKYTFSRKDKVLNYYCHKRRTVCDSLEKLIDVEMVRKL